MSLATIVDGDGCSFGETMGKDKLMDLSTLLLDITVMAYSCITNDHFPVVPHLCVLASLHVLVCSFGGTRESVN